MNVQRRVLKYILKILARIAIKKHDIKLIVVTGKFGTELSKEIIYNILNLRQHVRRNTVDIWWDLSVPLNILGYEDKQRTLLSWLNLLAKVLLVLALGRPAPHSIILNVNNENRGIVDYWASVLYPDYLLLVNTKAKTNIVSRLIANVKPDTGIIFCSEEIKNTYSKELKEYKVLSFGESKDNFIKTLQKKDKLVFIHNKKEIEVKKLLFPQFSLTLLPGIFAFAFYNGFEFAEIAYEVIKFQPQGKILTKIKKNILLAEK